MSCRKQVRCEPVRRPGRTETAAGRRLGGDRRGLSVDRPAANGDAPAIQLLKPGNRAQQGRFATPGRADDNAKFAICDVQANVAKHRCVAKRLVRPLYD